MARSSSVRKARGYLLQKPRGNFTSRVQAVGPERFGILSVDCAKARSKWLLCDFYGNVLVPPTVLPHTQADFAAAIERLRRVVSERPLADLVVAIERTGAYHRPVQHAFRAAGFETRLVHPYASKQFRQPADPNNKTDDTDLGGIFRAAVQGFGLLEPTLPDVYQQMQLLVRERRDLVRKVTRLRCQIKEALHQLMPGFAELSPSHLFENRFSMPLVHATGSAQAVLDAGLMGLQRLFADDRSPRLRDLQKVVDWARTAAAPHPQAAILRLTLRRLDHDRLEKLKQIRDLEAQAARLLVHTPYVVLLALPGINGVTACQLAGEAGPIDNYAEANNITGRAGLAPARYQSDQVDVQGALRRHGNRRLRAALMHIADCLVRHNRCFQATAQLWQRQGKDARWIRVKVAKRFSRLAFVLLHQRRVLFHPACQPRHSIYEKLLAFHHERRTDTRLVLEDLDQAARQLAPKARPEEIRALKDWGDSAKNRGGVTTLKNLIPLVLARLRVRQVQSKAEGRDPN
jgi:transposase